MFIKIYPGNLSTQIQINAHESLKRKRYVTLIDKEDFKVGLMYLDKHITYPLHAHDPTEIYHVLLGEGYSYHTVEKKRF
eukprot:UN19511